MQYFKNVDLTKMYPVSEKAVRNWIAAAKEGKLELALHEEGGRTYIANTSQNAAIIDRLVNERKKYVNSKGRKTVHPISKFYEVYNKDQIFDIITNLETYGAIPLKYSYFNKGAEYWDMYTRKLSSEPVPNLLKRTVELLDFNIEYLLYLLDSYSKVNIIDIGPGNGLPVKQFLERLIKEGKVHRYIALDVSPSMLNIVERNMKEWFGDEFHFEGYIKDIVDDRFKDILGVDAVGANNERVCNIVLVFGGVLANVASPKDGWRSIHNSISVNDILITARKLDSEAAKRYFDFNIDNAAPKRLSPLDQMIIDYLSIEDNMYEVEQFYDENKNRRVIQIRLTVALTIEFAFEDFTRRVNFNKGDTIMVWQAWHQTSYDVLDELEDNGFKLLQASHSKDHEYLLTISGVRSR